MLFLAFCRRQLQAHTRRSKTLCSDLHAAGKTERASLSSRTCLLHRLQHARTAGMQKSGGMQYWRSAFS